MANPVPALAALLTVASLGVAQGPAPGTPSTVKPPTLNPLAINPPTGEIAISPSRPVPAGGAPGMRVTQVADHGDERVFAVIFSKGDEVLSGLTDFAVQNHVTDAHFTGIGAVLDATTGWLDLSAKAYRGTVTREQVEVLSLIGDIATYQGKPVVHAHLVLGRRDGSTVGGHLWEAHVNPTLEVFVTADAKPLGKKLDEASGMKVIEAK